MELEGVNAAPVPVIIDWFLSQECYEKVILQSKWSDGSCLQLILSKSVGYFILVTMSLFMKMPQLIKIIQSGSATGVNVLSEILLMMTSTIGVCYNIVRGYPISTWGESVALSVQSFAIVFTILLYRSQSYAAISYTIISFLCTSVLLSPALPLHLLSSLQVMAIPLVSASKILQIQTNWRAGSTGQLSALTIGMQNFRTFGRLFSSFIETGDVYRITQYATASALNTVLTAQMFFYSRGQTKKNDLKESDNHKRKYV